MTILRSMTMAILALYFTMAVAEPANINTADAVTIATAMKGVGEKRAAAIIAYRKEHGDFASIDDLTQIKGIGKKTIDKNRENITVNASSNTSVTSSNPK